MTRTLAAAALLALAACSQPQVNQSLTAVAVAEDALAAAGSGILACYSTPVCNAAAASRKAQIRIAFDTADESLKVARQAALSGGNVDMTTVNTTIAQLQAIVSSLPKS